MNILKKFFPKKDTIVFDIEIIDGLHLRPCAKISTVANKFNSYISIRHKNKIKNIKNMNDILSLGLIYGDIVEIVALGDDSNEAIISIKSLFDELSNVNEMSDLSKEDYSDTNSYIGIKSDGVKISSGIALGVPFFMKKSEVSKKDIVCFDDAIDILRNKLEKLSMDEENELKDIFVAQTAMLNTLPETSLENFNNAINGHILDMQGTLNESKIADYQDIQNSIYEIMYSMAEIDFPIDNSIMIAKEILPSDISKIIKSNVKGVVLQEISLRSHVALLLRSYNIPAIKIEDIDTLECMDIEVILDANNNTIVTKPTDDDIDYATNKIQTIAMLLEKQNLSKFEPAVTKSGKAIEILANITDYNSAIEAKESGANGIGLFRTEFLFQKIKPTVDMQILEYEKIFMIFDDVTVRTLDVGGDKKLPYLVIPSEENPFLGIRGVRLFKTNLDIMKDQIYAILVAKRAKKLKIMFPMVSCVDEFLFAKNIALDIARENNLDLSNVSFGIMVEVPSVLFLVSEFNKVVDFYSIGTNDLAQYLFAIDRTHTSLEIDSSSPVIFDAIKMLNEKSTRPVSICGELAGDISATSRLIDIGIEMLSVPPALIASLKSRIRDV